jgi:hypothetical protein
MLLIAFLTIKGRTVQNRVVFMKKWSLCSVFVLMVIILTSCGTRYKIQGETFSSSSEALQKQASIFSKFLDDVKPIDNPIHGTVLVLIPSDAEIQKNFIRFSHNAGNIKKEIVDFLISRYRNFLQFPAEAIRKRNLFESIIVDRHNGNPMSFLIGGFDYVVFADVDGWYLRIKGNPIPLAIPFDNTESIDLNHILIFLDSIDQQAKKFR